MPMRLPTHWEREKAKAPTPTREDRPSAPDRGYDSRWREARRQHLMAYPLCRACQSAGMTTAAELVDHITPHRGDQALFWDISNWQSLCRPCHDRKTARERSLGSWHA